MALDQIEAILAGVGAWTLLSAALRYQRDRTGNSGRMDHHLRNPRIVGAGDDE